ncbi:hypothetical protein E3T43_07205 [Cryobacterium sp. Hh7]|uniref:hypothetical protein n=1 Tax=Cryobacterium sp. Hh7 TaxID=1259159 RepID=UPI00106C7CF6|nr:hypothetical protein [Cryobacterium sp. Hh7]TFD58028.1 hypothetical protein E3T43_07205 [Cryobacterium sp. Hh7]
MGTAHVKIIPEIDPAELDAAMIEAIAVRVAAINRGPKLKLAKSIVIDGDKGTVAIDGTLLGYFLDKDGPTFERSDRPGGLTVVNLRILTQSAKYTGPARA